MFDLASIVALLSFLIWLFLLLFWRGYWRIPRTLRPDVTSAISQKARVLAIVPARNEGDVITRTLDSIAHQTFAGELNIYLMNDHSDDKTGPLAKNVIGNHPVYVHDVPDRPDGWSGKVWAMHAGLMAARKNGLSPDYIWFTDADIWHDPSTLSWLVEKARSEDLSLVSFMAHLHCRSFVERLLVPAFIYFFQMLYPFAWSNRPKSSVSAAAGGCMLVHADCVLNEVGLAPIRDKIIDDCALARFIKHEQGRRIWLGHGLLTRSIRPYRFVDLWNTVARTAYTQLCYSPFLLIGAILGLAIVFLAPPVLAISMVGVVGGLALSAWFLMLLSYLPTLWLYGVNPLFALFLPVSAVLYMGMTLHSALRHWRGQGGGWKGRTYQNKTR